MLAGWQPAWLTGANRHWARLPRPLWPSQPMPARRAGHALRAVTAHETPRWHGHQHPTVGQGAGASVGLAPVGEGEGAGTAAGTDAHWVGSATAGQEEEGRRGGASRAEGRKGEKK
jgi:hypothetical protein